MWATSVVRPCRMTAVKLSNRQSRSGPWDPENYSIYWIQKHILILRNWDIILSSVELNTKTFLCCKNIKRNAFSLLHLQFFLLQQTWIIPFLQTQTFREQLLLSSEEIFSTVRINWRTNSPINFVVFLMLPLFVFSLLPHHTIPLPTSCHQHTCQRTTLRTSYRQLRGLLSGGENLFLQVGIIAPAYYQCTNTTCGS